MNLAESLTIAYEGMTANKMRAVLTMLGVVIGVAAVITMMALARGAQDQMLDRIKQMGTNVLFVYPGRVRSAASGGFQVLKMEDAEAIAEECPSVKAVAPETQMSAQVKYQDQNANTTILGTTPEFLSIRNYHISAGRMFTDDEVSTYRRVAVIGPTTASTLFGDDPPVGQSLRINGSQFEVVGLMKSKGAVGGFNDQDDQIVIPVTTETRRLMGTHFVRSLSVQATSMQLMDKASEEIRKVMNTRHPPPPDVDSLFEIRNQSEIMTMAEETGRMFTLLLAGIASVSLLVGGIGIMNIMLVSVTERTHEIGIRLAMGARRRDIQRQFLLEAMVLSLFGGVIGVVVGVVGSIGINYLSSMHAVVTVASVAIAFGFAALVGVVFGYYPAQQAALLDPIIALRYE